LTQAIKCENGDFCILDATVADFPDGAFRSVLVDPSSRLIPMEEMRALILLMAKAKMNVLHFHFFDAGGSAVRFKHYPDFPTPPGGAYTDEELREIISYAGSFGIDVMPELDVPAHNFAMTTWNTDLKCKVKNADGTDAEKISGWNLCLGNEKSYEIIDTMLGEIAEIFPYECIHIGTDEIEMRDLALDPAIISHSEECEVCNRFFNPLGLTGLQERFYWFVRRLYNTISSLGKKMMMWNDWIDISKSPALPRDILIEIWRVAGEKRGPREGCSMQRFLEEGFEVLNADFPNTYVEEYATWERLKPWSFRADPADASACPHSVIGVDMCAWGYMRYNFFRYTIPYAVVAYGDKSRSTAPIEDDLAARRALSRAVLGCDTPADFDLFAYLNGVPLGDAMEMKSVLAEDADTEALCNVLKTLRHQSDDEKRYTEALMHLAQSKGAEDACAADAVSAMDHA
jgi:hypothetical protein